MTTDFKQNLAVKLHTYARNRALAAEAKSCAVGEVGEASLQLKPLEFAEAGWAEWAARDMGFEIANDLVGCGLWQDGDYAEDQRRFAGKLAYALRESVAAVWPQTVSSK